MKILRRAEILLVGLWAAAALTGCPKEATDQTGVFVPNMQGTYNRASVTTFCENLGIFDASTEIVQDEDRVILQAVTAGFEDYSGTVDKDGVVALIGAGTECEGTYASSRLACTCNVTVVTCSIDPDTGEEKCNEQIFSCSVSYEKI